MAAHDQYKTPLAFKTALEARIRAAAEGRIARLRQLLLFQRFLARVFAVFGERIVLKGGLVLELRLQRARTTKDVDLRLTGSPDSLLEQLQEAGRSDPGDWLQFEVAPDPRHPVIDGEGLVYQGQRFRVLARLAGKQYGSPFGVDVGVADVLTAEPEMVQGSDFFEFVSVPPPSLRIYPRVTHVAEKLHAYTLPRERENTRVKDLPDMALLGQTGPFVAEDLRRALAKTFEFRATHELPQSLPAPPASWGLPYARTAELDDLQWKTLADVHAAVAAFLDPVLMNSAGTWEPDAWAWTR